MSALDVYPVKIRIANALVSYVSYIGQMVWPRGLAVFYPHPGTRLPVWHAVGAGLLLACISIAVIRAARRHPYLAVGWLWYLGTLVPVIGLVQVGAQAMADRYTYVPLIGLFVIIAWSIPDFLAGNHYRKIVLSMAVGTVLLALTVSSWLQVQHWKNNLTLFKHALKVTAKNYVAHDSLGNALAQQGKVEEAIDHYYEALKIKPNLVNLHNNLGVALLEQRKVKEAMSHYDIALRLNADYAETYNNFGVAWFTVGEFDKAIAHYHEALRLDPAYGKAHNNMGNALVEHGRFEEAILHYSKALETKVHYPEAHNNLGVALAQQGKLNEAIVQFKEALRLKPDYTQARANLDLALALVGEATDAPKSISAPLK